MKIRSSTLALVFLFGTFFLTWHNRASLIEIGKTAAATDVELSKDCS